MGSGNMDGRQKHAPPHLAYRAEFGHSGSNSVGVNNRFHLNPKYWGSAYLVRSFCWMWSLKVKPICETSGTRPQWWEVCLLWSHRTLNTPLASWVTMTNSIDHCSSKYRPYVRKSVGQIGPITSHLSKSVKIIESDTTDRSSISQSARLRRTVITATSLSYGKMKNLTL